MIQQTHNSLFFVQHLEVEKNSMLLKKGRIVADVIRFQGYMNVSLRFVVMFSFCCLREYCWSGRKVLMQAAVRVETLLCYWKRPWVAGRSVHTLYLAWTKDPLNGTQSYLDSVQVANYFQTKSQKEQVYKKAHQVWSVYPNFRSSVFMFYQ